MSGVSARFRVNVPFANPASKSLLEEFARKSAESPAVRRECFAQARLIQSQARANLQSASKAKNWQVRETQKLSQAVRVEPVLTFSRRSVLPGSPIPVALVSTGTSVSAMRWEHGSKNIPATHYFTRAYKAAKG